MKILQLCHKPPYPSNDGGTIAMHALSSNLSDSGIQVKIMGIATPKHPFEKEKLTSNYLETYSPVFFNKNTLPNNTKAFLSLFSKEVYHTQRFFDHRLAIALTKELTKNNYDAVILESLFVYPYFELIKQYSQSKVIYRSHNVEYLLWQNRNKTTTNPLKKAGLSLLTKRLEKTEKECFKKVDAIWTISYQDQKHIHSFTKSRIDCIPFSIDLDRYSFEKTNNKVHNVFFLGALDWEPNIEGLKWFINEVWPNVLSSIPSVKFILAGRNPISWFKTINQKGIQYVGEVENAIDFMAKNGIMVIPLFSGSGIRIKALEGFAIGKTIVSTKKGLEGINVSNGKEAFIEDDPVKMAHVIVSILKKEAHTQQVAENGHYFVKKEFDSQNISKRLYTCLSEVCKTK